MNLRSVVIYTHTLSLSLEVCTGICALHRMRSAIYGWNEPGSKIDAVCQLFVYACTRVTRSAYGRKRCFTDHSSHDSRRVTSHRVTFTSRHRSHESDMWAGTRARYNALKPDSTQRHTTTLNAQRSTLNKHDSKLMSKL